MIVLDANLLLYAYDITSPQHKNARQWLEETLKKVDSVAIPWLTIQAFLRISTDSRIMAMPFTPEKAVSIVETWLALPQVRLLAQGESHWQFFRSMILEGQSRGALLTDAALAALTMEHGGTIYSTDRDFARFPGLRWINPLEN
jgi:uncharacterized protein